MILLRMGIVLGNLLSKYILYLLRSLSRRRRHRFFTTPVPATPTATTAGAAAGAGATAAASSSTGLRREGWGEKEEGGRGSGEINLKAPNLER